MLLSLEKTSIWTGRWKLLKARTSNRSRDIYQLERRAMWRSLWGAGRISGLLVTLIKRFFVPLKIFEISLNSSTKQERFRQRTEGGHTTGKGQFIRRFCFSVFLSWPQSVVSLKKKGSNTFFTVYLQYDFNPPKTLLFGISYSAFSAEHQIILLVEHSVHPYIKDSKINRTYLKKMCIALSTEVSMPIMRPSCL